MLKKLLLILFIIPVYCKAQIINPGLMDTSSGEHIGKISVSGYLDTYYHYNFSQPKSGNVPYLISMNRHNEANINLAFIDLRYKSERLRSRIVPGFGTYMNENYAQESGSLKNLVEANAGIKIFKEKEIWLDYGILGSPYTNESAISKDHLMYSRSFAPEYVPYYLSGLKLSLPINSKISAFIYALNGWQQIKDQNNSKSLGTQIEYRPNDKLLINWDTYAGNEKSSVNPTFRNRYFSDLYFIYNPNDNFSSTFCLYAGIQEVNNTNPKTWWQVNYIARKKISQNTSLSARIEYFNDVNQIQIKTITNQTGFETYGTGLCFNWQLFDNALFRIETREFISPKKVYLNQNNKPVHLSNSLIANMCIWF